MYNEDYFLKAKVDIRRVVIWGFVFPVHSHHFIHLGFFQTLKKINFPVLWLDDTSSNNSYLNKGDMIITVDICMKNLVPHKNIFYCLHNPIPGFIKNIKNENYFFLQVLTKKIYDKFYKKNFFELSGQAFFDSYNKVLYQSWGTPLLPHEFKSPNYIEFKKIEYFIGSVWNNDLNQGNELAIHKYKSILNDIGIKFRQIKGCPEKFNSLFVRHSAFASSIVGDWQKKNGYTPCRLFKAISYGRLASINSVSSKIQYPWIFSNESIDKLITNIFEMKKDDYIDLVFDQQRNLKNETYYSKISNIFHIFSLLKES